MFAWRKPKPESDEPLVPHGLVWQATEEPMPAEAERIDPEPVQENSSPILVPPMRLDPPGAANTVSDEAPPKMGSMSDPLPWASMNAKDAVKRLPPFWDRTDGPKIPSPISVPHAPADAKVASFTVAKSEVAAAPAQSVAPDRRAARQIVIKQFLVERKQELHGAWAEFSHAIAELCANARHLYAGWEIRKNLRQTRERAQAHLAKRVVEKAPVVVAPVAVAPEEKTPSRMQARLAVARNRAARMHHEAVASIASSANSARGMMHRQIRIRVSAGSQFRSYLGQLQNAQRESRKMLQRNSRLATSLAMAALSALLTLGLILTIGHYQPSASANAPAVHSSQTQGAITQSQPATTIPANTISAKPSPAAGAHPVPTRTNSPVVNTALREPANTSGAKTAHRPHHNADEDYVAPNTTVYYGKRR